MSKPVATLVVYRPKRGLEGDLQGLIEKHGSALRASGLITSSPVRAWTASDKRSGAKFFVEMFEWKDGEASEIAHQTPEIMAVWEPMGPALEEMTIAKLEPLAVSA